MIPVTTFRGARVAVFGLGGSGLATARALREGGATVIVGDDGPERRKAAAEEGFAVADLSDPRAIDGAAALILSPGVPLTHKDGAPFLHPVVAAARGAGAEIIGDVELFARERRARAPDAAFVAVTGTNGKSTTTALIAHLLRSAGRDAQTGGNIGVPVLSLAPPDPERPDRVHVVECSSFQIDLAPSLRAGVGVHLNVTPDHLDRHGTLQDYAAIKERLVANAEFAVIGVDDDVSAAFAARRGRRHVVVSGRRELPDGLGVAGTKLVLGPRAAERFDGTQASALEPGVLADLATAGALRGAHNAQNAAAAAAAALALGLTPAEIRIGLDSFPGLAHRLEMLGRRGRVLFVNDSKATNADSTDKALAAFPGAIHWIVGGKPKAGGIEPLLPHASRIAQAYLIGEAADEFAATLDGRVPVSRCGTLERAVAEAAEAAAAADGPLEPVVLLSPACASYDQYRNFEERGDAFRALVARLPGFEPIR